MSGSINKVIIVGNLVADPEVKGMQSGDKLVNLRVATNETWRDRNSGERRERAEFHRVVIFNEPLVKVSEQYLRKGSKVYVEGQLETRKWQDQSGQDRYTTEIALRPYRGDLVLLDGRPSGESGGTAYSGDDRRHGNDSDGRASGGSGYGAGGRPGGGLDDEIPFLMEGRL